MNNTRKIGLDDKGMGAISGPEKMKLTPLVEPPGIERVATTHSRRLRLSKVGGGNIKNGAMLLVFAAAFILVTAVAFVALEGQKLAKVPGRVSDPPPKPLVILGSTLNSTFDPIPYCHVNISDTTVGKYCNTVMSDGAGVYSYDIKNWSPQIGDHITVEAWNYTALNGTRTGTNFAIVTGTAVAADELQIDVVLATVLIPEFTSIAVPLACMLSILAVARVASNRSREE